MYSRAEKAAHTIRARTTAQARIAIVLGSGLGGFAEEFADSVSIPYQQIPGFVTSTAVGHAGRLVCGKVEQVPVIAMQGRVHYYEGYSLEQVTFPIRTFKLLGVETLILTNAAGGIDVQLTQGALMVISDHLNLMGVNPLRGPNDERFGPRFPDMSEVYSRELQELVIEEARGLGVPVRRGIYAALAGPSYETPAEIHMLRATGADAVGMSTVPEAIVARQMGMKILGISCITNMAAGISENPINHEEVMETGQRVRATLTQLLRRLIARMPG
ncbi:MAG TPA: purine-nucleoside phosphorylase [Blastocatellia bacterium]|nr:purine-nucleoside phosphorylase [Blastocatellia bacterium]HAF25027.1 purine-nucleoside phosphorylase [Blastocatellia bacterium]HCX31237.1 purine-nucleoside phosphorylase [Blastocatellia bacterium]